MKKLFLLILIMLLSSSAMAEKDLSVRLKKAKPTRETYSLVGSTKVLAPPYTITGVHYDSTGWDYGYNSKSHYVNIFPQGSGQVPRMGICGNRAIVKFPKPKVVAAVPVKKPEPLPNDDYVVKQEGRSGAVYQATNPIIAPVMPNVDRLIMPGTELVNGTRRETPVEMFTPFVAVTHWDREQRTEEKLCKPNPPPDKPVGPCPPPTVLPIKPPTSVTTPNPSGLNPNGPPLTKNAPPPPSGDRAQVVIGDSTTQRYNPSPTHRNVADPVTY